MIVRCGACRTEFDAPGEGRHPCPSCGAVNQVSTTRPAATPRPPGGPSPSAASPPAAPEPAILSRVTCGECAFEFVVGDIELATCPNCSAEVKL